MDHSWLNLPVMGSFSIQSLRSRTLLKKVYLFWHMPWNLKNRT